MNKLRRAVAIAIAMATAALLATMFAAPAIAAEQEVSRTGSVLTSQLPLKDPNGDPTKTLLRPVFRLNGLPLRAGQPVGLSGTLQTKAQYLGSLQAQVLHCHESLDHNKDYYSTWTTTNHLSPENGAKPGTVVTTSGQWLFTPPSTGDYDCTLYGRGGRNPYPANHPTEYLTVVGGSLAIDLTPRSGGVEWRQPTVEQVGTPTPRYADAKWVLVKKWDAPVSVSTTKGGRTTRGVNNGLDKVRIRTETQLSAISIGKAGAAAADVTTYVTQLTPHGTKCQRYTKATRAVVPGKLHHHKVAHTLLVPYNPSCSNRFAVQVLVDYVRNQGMQVEGPSYTSAHIHPWE